MGGVGGWLAGSDLARQTRDWFRIYSFAVFLSAGCWRTEHVYRVCFVFEVIFFLTILCISMLGGLTCVNFWCLAKSALQHSKVRLLSALVKFHNGGTQGPLKFLPTATPTQYHFVPRIVASRVRRQLEPWMKLWTSPSGGEFARKNKTSR